MAKQSKIVVYHDPHTSGGPVKVTFREAKAKVQKQVYPTPKQLKLQAKHGTPAEFAIAAEKAFADGFCNAAECARAVANYLKEWREAGK